MKRAIKHPDVKDDFSLAPYSAAILDGNYLFISGQVPFDYLQKEWKFGTIESETNKVFDNLIKVLEASNCTLNDVVKTTVFLKDLDDFDAFNKVYATYFKGIKPARSTVQVGLGAGMKVEIEAIAKINKAD